MVNFFSFRPRRGQRKLKNHWRVLLKNARGQGMPAASVPKEAAFVAPLRGVRPCKETGQLLRGAGGQGAGC